jgi:hypothetical protein
LSPLPLRIRSEAAGSILRAFRGDRCLASALLRRPYSTGPMFTLSSSDGADRGSAENILEARRKLRAIALAFEAETASRQDNEPAAEQARKTASYLSIDEQIENLDRLLEERRQAEILRKDDEDLLETEPTSGRNAL